MDSDSDPEDTYGKPSRGARKLEEKKGEIFRFLTSNNLEGVKTFLDNNPAGMFINTNFSNNLTPLDIAFQNRNIPMANMLIKYGANQKTLPKPTGWNFPTNGGKKRNKKSKKNKRKSKKRNKKSNKRRR